MEPGTASLEDRKDREVKIRTSGGASLQALGVTGRPIGELVAARDKEKNKGSISSETGMKLSCFHAEVPSPPISSSLGSRGWESYPVKGVA